MIDEETVLVWIMQAVFCWKYLLGAAKTWTELHLNNLSIHLTNSITWFVKKRLKSNRPDQKDCSISYTVHKQSFYHLFAIKTVYSKLDGREILILYPIYLNCIDT